MYDPLVMNAGAGRDLGGLEVGGREVGKLPQGGHEVGNL